MGRSIHEIPRQDILTQESRKTPEVVQSTRPIIEGSISQVTRTGFFLSAIPLQTVIFMEHFKKHDLIIISSSREVWCLGGKRERFTYALSFVFSCVYCGVCVARRRIALDRWACDRDIHTDSKGHQNKLWLPWAVLTWDGGVLAALGYLCRLFPLGYTDKVWQQLRSICHQTQRQVFNHGA